MNTTEQLTESESPLGRPWVYMLRGWLMFLFGSTLVVLTAIKPHVTMLSKDFIKLVLFANLLAWPIAWYAANQWLRIFAYSINIGWWVFMLAGGFALVIALLTVSMQAIRAAVANPVDSLRYE